MQQLNKATWGVDMRKIQPLTASSRMQLIKKKKAFGCYPGERSLRRDRRTVLLGFALRTTQNYQICKVREESLMSQG